MNRLLKLLIPLLLLVFLAWLHRVPQRITEEDKVYLDLFLAGIPDEAAHTYETQLEQIAAIQRAVLSHAPPGASIPEGQPREPRQLWERGHGACYDISRTLEKALRYRGYRTRHAALYENLWRRSSRSHAATEVKTLRGWLVVENAAPWLGLDADGRPWSYRQPFPPAWQTPPPQTVIAFYNQPFSVVYGLYSRHGRFYPPYTAWPDMGF